MFSGFDQSIDTEARKRFAASSAASTGIYGLIAIGLAIGSAATSSVAAEKVLDVTFRSAPKATPALPPPAAPPVPKDVAVKVRVARGVAARRAGLIPDQSWTRPIRRRMQSRSAKSPVTSIRRQEKAWRPKSDSATRAGPCRVRAIRSTCRKRPSRQPDASNAARLSEEARTKGIEVWSFSRSSSRRRVASRRSM